MKLEQNSKMYKCIYSMGVIISVVIIGTYKIIHQNVFEWMMTSFVCSYQFMQRYM